MKNRLFSFSAGGILNFFSMGFGAGLIRPAPGTWGSLAGIVLYMAADVFFPGFGLYLVLAVILFGGVCSAGYTEKQMGEKDPSSIVIDEIAGIWISCFMLPWELLPAAFIVFRILDISKVFPVSYFERIPGGWGIMLDDVAAGIISRILLGLFCAGGFYG